MKKLLVISLFCVAARLSSQELSVGATACTLMPTAGEWYNIKLFNPFKVSRHMVGAVVNYAPEGRYYFFNSGLLMMSHDIDQFLKVPVTVNVFFGRNVKGYLILGCYNTFRLNTSSDLYRFYDLGLDYGIGGDYKVTSHVRIFMEYNMYFGIIPYQRTSINDDFYSTDYAFFHFGFKYIL